MSMSSSMGTTEFGFKILVFSSEAFEWEGDSDKPKTDRSFNQHCDTYFELDLYFLHLSGTGGVEFMFIS